MDSQKEIEEQENTQSQNQSQENNKNISQSEEEQEGEVNLENENILEEIYMEQAQQEQEQNIGSTEPDCGGDEFFVEYLAHDCQNLLNQLEKKHVENQKLLQNHQEINPFHDLQEGQDVVLPSDNAKKLLIDPNYNIDNQNDIFQMNTPPQNTGIMGQNCHIIEVRDQLIQDKKKLEQSFIDIQQEIASKQRKIQDFQNQINIETQECLKYEGKIQQKDEVLGYMLQMQEQQLQMQTQQSTIQTHQTLNTQTSN